MTQRTPINETITAKIEIEAPEKICGVISTSWRFTKSAPYGYWGYEEHVMKWFVVPFERQANWEYDYLLARGFKTYVSTGRFQHRFTTWRGNVP